MACIENSCNNNSCLNYDPTESSRKTKIIIGVILILCLIIGLGVYFGIYYENDFENQETTTRITLSTTTIKTTISTTKTTTTTKTTSRSTTSTTTKVTSTTFNEKKCGYQYDVRGSLVISYLMICFGIIGIFLSCPFLFLIDGKMDLLFFSTCISLYLLNATSAFCFFAFYYKSLSLLL